MHYPVLMPSVGWAHSWKRALVLASPFVLGSPLAALVYQKAAEATDAYRYPPMVELVDIGGHRLHLCCSGSGSPTVVVESGRGSYSIDWVYLQQAVAKFTRICTDGRAGYGWSDPNHAPRSMPEIAVYCRF